MSGHPTVIHERVAQARAGENPAVIARMASGWAVLGDHRFLPGYALLPVWSYPAETLRSVPFLSQRHGVLHDALAEPPAQDGN